MNKRELHRNVLRGVKLLDEKDSGWWNGGSDASPVIAGMVGHIDLDKLDLESLTHCVLGQRCVSSNPYESVFTQALTRLGIDGDQELYGFARTSSLTSDSEEFSYLTELWASVIQSRRFPRRKIARDPFVVRANRTWVRPGAAS